MQTWFTALSWGALTAVRFVGFPSFVLLVAFSLGWRWRTGAWLPLWKLGLTLLVLILLGTLGFAVAWSNQLGASS